MTAPHVWLAKALFTAIDASHESRAFTVECEGDWLAYVDFEIEAVDRPMP